MKTVPTALRRFAIQHGIFCLVIVCSALLGLLLTSKGIHMWDDGFRYNHSKWLLAQFTGETFRLPYGNLNKTIVAYGPIWELVLAFATEYFFVYLRDPYWVRHALTFSLFPITLYVYFRALLRIGYTQATALLSTTVVFSILRLGGHSLFNMKDATGALAFFICSVLLWELLSNYTKKASYRTLMSIGIIGLLPFLVRTPLLLHATVALGAVFMLALRKQASVLQRILIIGIPIATMLVLLYVLYPPVWNKGLLDGMLSSFSSFSSHDSRGLTRLFGMSFPSTAIPWWYAFGWIPVIIHPLGLGISCIGLALLLLKKSPGTTPKLQLLPWVQLSFEQWMCCIVVLSWCAVVLLVSTLYMEERHILFLYPPLFALGSLGWQHVQSRIQYGMSSALVIATLATYVHWGQYSYIYKSPIIGPTSASHFLGDYFGICLGDAVRSLPDTVPEGYTVQTPSFANIQYKRLRNSTYLYDSRMGKYTLTEKKPSAPYARMYFYNNISSNTGFNQVQKDIAAGKAKKVWSSSMPPGDESCVIALYE